MVPSTRSLGNLFWRAKVRELEGRGGNKVYKILAAVTYTLRSCRGGACILMKGYISLADENFIT